MEGRSPSSRWRTPLKDFQCRDRRIAEEPRLEQRQKGNLRLFPGKFGLFGRWPKPVHTASSDKIVRMWEFLNSGAGLKQFQGPSKGFLGVAASSDGRRIATMSDDKTIRVWNVGSGTETLKLAAPARIREHGGCASAGARGSIVFSRDGSKLLTSGPDGATAALWDADTGAQLQSFTNEAVELRSAASSRPTSARWRRRAKTNRQAVGCCYRRAARHT